MGANKNQMMGPPRETEITAKLDDNELLSLQEQVMRQQDEDLSQIEKGVTTTKVKILMKY